MRKLQKMGGISALYAAAAYVVGIVFYMFLVDYAGAVEPLQKVALLADNQALMYILTLIVYVAFAPFLVVLALALYDRLRASSQALMQTATAIGLIWAGAVIASGMIFNMGTGVVVNLHSTDPAQAATVWLAIEAVFEGIGGGTEILGGLWILLVSWVALRAAGLPKVLNYLGLALGVVGILSIVPALSEAGAAVFGFGQIVWFVWLGIVLLRTRDHAPA
jgi:hypothetical protein